MNNCRGQGYDSAGIIAGKYQGAAALFQRQYPLATYVHCALHWLNLCIVSSCQILLVQRMMDKVKAVADFFNNSPKRQQLLEKHIDNLLQGQRHRKLTDVCRTRWISCINAQVRFQQMFEPIKVTLEEIENNAEGHWNYDCISIAADLLFAFDFKFIMSLVITRNILDYAKSTYKKIARR